LSEVDGKPQAGCKCVKCGLCIAACPTEALISTTTPTLKLNQLMLKAKGRAEQLLVSCPRAEVLLAGGGEQSQAALQAFLALRAAENLAIVPCLGSVAKELWFALLAEIGEPEQEELAVLLLPGQCDDCPVAASGAAAELMDESLSTAELWSGLPVELTDDVVAYHARVQRGITAALSSDAELGKREAVEQLFGGLKQSWQKAGAKQGRAVREVQSIRSRADAIEKTRYGANLRGNKGGVMSGGAVFSGFGANSLGRAKVTSRRHILLETLGLNPELAGRVELTISTTEPKLCTLCSKCIDACPLKARVRQDATEGTNGCDGTPAHVATDDLICEGCTACVQACETGACQLTVVCGSSFLLC
jgi:ferredoxin